MDSDEVDDKQLDILDCLNTGEVKTAFQGISCRSVNNRIAYTVKKSFCFSFQSENFRIKE